MSGGEAQSKPDELTGERRMYPAVSRMFIESGYSTLEDVFTIEPYPGFERRVDVVAYRWKGKRFETVAVECKDDRPPRGMIDALSQAITYRLYFDDVYIATEAGQDLSGLNILTELGIGYITTGSEESRIITHASPGRLRLLDIEKSIRHVRSRLKALSIFGDFVAPEDYRQGGLRGQDELWCAHDLFGEFQQNLWLNEENDRYHSGVNLEHKPTEKRIFDKMGRKDASQLSRLMGELPESFGIILKRIRRVPRKNPPVFAEPTIADPTALTRKLLRHVRAILREPYWAAEISISRPVWTVPEDITLEKGIRILGDVRRELTPLNDFFQDLYSR